MKNLFESNAVYVPQRKEELITLIIKYQIDLIELEVKLGMVDKCADEEYISKFSAKLEKLNVDSLKKYFNVIKKIYMDRKIKYDTKVKEEQANLYEQLVQAYLESLDPEIAELLKKYSYLDEFPEFPVIPGPVRPGNPLQPVVDPNLPWWSPNNPLRIYMKDSSEQTLSLR